MLYIINKYHTAEKTGKDVKDGKRFSTVSIQLLLLVHLGKLID